MSHLLNDAPVEGRTAHLYYKATIDGTGSPVYSDPIYTDDFPVTVSIDPGAGVTAAYVLYTITPRSVLQAGDPLVDGIWHVWPIGSIANADGKKIDAILGPVSAVACHADGGEVFFEVLQKAPGA